MPGSAKAWIGANAADSITTAIGLALGMTEVNLHMALLINSIGSWPTLSIKLIAAILLVWILRRHLRILTIPTVAIALAAILNGAQILALMVLT